MNLIVTPVGERIQVVEVTDERLDDENGKSFCDALHGSVKERQSVVLDLSSVRFMDTSGLSQLVSCQHLQLKRRISWRLCALHPNVLFLFELARLERLFRFHRNRQEAINAFLKSEALRRHAKRSVVKDFTLGEAHRSLAPG